MERPTSTGSVPRARREALCVGVLFLAAAVYSLTWCYTHGGPRPLAELRFVLWFPDWVFGGIVVPWLVCAAASCVFALRLMSDDELPPEAPPPSPAEGPRG